MIGCPINRNPLSEIHSLFATHAFVCGAQEHVCHGFGILILSGLSFWFLSFRCSLEAFVQAASSLEELIIVWSAIEHPLNRTVVA